MQTLVLNQEDNCNLQLQPLANVEMKSLIFCVQSNVSKCKVEQ